MKKLSKKLRYAGTMVLLLLSLTGCQGKALNEGKIAETLPDYVKMLDMYYDGISNVVMLDVDKVEIEKRQTNEKDDTVYCTIYKSNEDYESVEEWVLYYNYYDEGGWILDNAEQLEGEITPISGVPQDYVEAEMYNYYFDSFEYVNNGVYQDELGTHCSNTFNAAYAGENMKFNGQVALVYDFEQTSGNSGRWRSNLEYIDQPEWDVVGNWYMSHHIVLNSNEEFYLEIISFDGYTVEYEAKTVLNDNVFGKPYVDEHNYSGYADVSYERVEMAPKDQTAPDEKYLAPGFVFGMDTGFNRWIVIAADEAYAAGDMGSGITWRYFEMYKNN